MADEETTKETEVPAVSPTGKAIIPPVVVKVLVPVVSVAGSVLIAPTLGFDLSFLPVVVMKTCTVIAFLGFVLLGASPGARK